MTKFDPKIHHRHSLRLRGYDYSQAGFYFITIVTQGREALFGEVVDGEMRLNRYGEIIQRWWNEIPKHFPNVELGAFVIMPNHLHGIIIIHENRRGTVPVTQGGETLQPGGETPPLRKPTLGQVAAYFKYQTTKEINALKGGPVTRIWQRIFYDHIIRNQHDLELTWLYIESNPARWGVDHENPHR
ncbi:MAG: transposase [Chloroflexi bacterium]|nr:transposase [Chloroflexota bacterium]